MGEGLDLSLLWQHNDSIIMMHLTLPFSSACSFPTLTYASWGKKKQLRHLTHTFPCFAFPRGVRKEGVCVSNKSFVKKGHVFLFNINHSKLYQKP